LAAVEAIQETCVNLLSLIRHHSAGTPRRWSDRPRLLSLTVLPLIFLALTSPLSGAAGESAERSSPNAGIGVQATEGLIAHWALDEATGTFAADAAGGYSATLAIGATWSTGWLGSGVTLDGTRGYVAAPIIDVPGSALTLAAWVKNTAFPSGEDQRIISKSSNTAKQTYYWVLSHAKRGRRNLLSFRLRTSTGSTTLIADTGDLQANSWYHAAATYDGVTMHLYLNGIEVGRTSKAGVIATNAAVPVDIGRDPNGSNYLSGVVDEVRIYNRALTAADITAVISDPGPSNEPPTVTLSTPASGASFSAPADITLTASASDPENRLADVQFYSDTTLLGTDASAPYTFTWSAVPAG
jgi:hypothetical protein